MIHNVMEEWVIPRESKTWIGPLTVTLNGAPYTNYTVCLVRDGVRPVVGDFAAPVADGTELGVVAGPNLAPGRYRIWVRKETALEDVWLDDVGYVVVT
jgi:hypothetical protein